MSLYQFIRKQLDETRDDLYVLPVPCLNVLNGGAHAENTMEFQEMMIAPVGATTLEDSIRMALKIYQALKDIDRQVWGGR